MNIALAVAHAICLVGTVIAGLRSAAKGPDDRRVKIMQEVVGERLKRLTKTTFDLTSNREDQGISERDLGSLSLGGQFSETRKRMNVKEPEVVKSVDEAFDANRPFRQASFELPTTSIYFRPSRFGNKHVTEPLSLDSLCNDLSVNAALVDEKVPVAFSGRSTTKDVETLHISIPISIKPAITMIAGLIRVLNDRVIEECILINVSNLDLEPLNLSVPFVAFSSTVLAMERPKKASSVPGHRVYFV